MNIYMYMCISTFINTKHAKLDSNQTRNTWFTFVFVMASDGLPSASLVRQSYTTRQHLVKRASHSKQTTLFDEVESPLYTTSYATPTDASLQRPSCAAQLVTHNSMETDEALCKSGSKPWHNYNTINNIWEICLCGWWLRIICWLLNVCRL